MEGLGINLGGLITQIVGFLVLFGLLYAVLYKPVLRMMDQRSARIKESLDTAEQVRQEAASSQEEMEKRMEEARAEGQTLITRAREMAERYREEEMTRARNEIRAERDRAQADIQRERDSAVEELRREFTGLAISAAERVIQRSLDTEAYRGIIEQVLEESSESNRR